MSIITYNTMEEANNIPDPKHIWVNGSEIIVYTEGDIPVNYRILSVKEFRDRFTEDEIEAILDLAYSGDVLARKILLKLQTVGEVIDLTTPSVIAGVNYWVSKGILTEERKNQILS